MLRVEKKRHPEEVAERPARIVDPLNSRGRPAPPDAPEVLRMPSNNDEASPSMQHAQGGQRG